MMMKSVMAQLVKHGEVRRGVGGCLAEHELELAGVDDRARVLLIEQRDAVGPVVGDRIPEDGQSLVILGMAELDELQVPGLAVLVCGVVADVDPLPVVTPPVPLVEKPWRCVLRHVLEQV